MGRDYETLTAKLLKVLWTDCDSCSTRKVLRSTLKKRSYFLFRIFRIFIYGKCALVFEFADPDVSEQDGISVVL